MAGLTGDWTMGFSVPFCLLMAFDAFQVHHPFRCKGTHFLHFLHGISFFWKYAMADIAIFFTVLMLGMGKGDIPLTAAINFDALRALVVCNSSGGHTEKETDCRSCYDNRKGQAHEFSFLL